MVDRWDDILLRGKDSHGDGAFAASRGSKRHKGEDYEFEEGQEVPTPVSGIVTRVGICYTDDHSYKLVEILSHKGFFLWRFLYISPTVRAEQVVKRGDIIGTAQNISKRYSTRTKKMKNHVHVEININPCFVIGGKDGS